MLWLFCSKRVFHYNPLVKIIVVLRDPVERAWSHYCHEVRLGVERLQFADAIERERSRAGEWSEKTEYDFEADHFSYAMRGRYEQQLHRWLDYFPLSQMLILKSESLFESPVENLNRIAAFLDVDSIDWKTKPVGVRNGTEIEGATKERLQSDFAFYNRNLEHLLGSEFKWHHEKLNV